MIYTRKAQFHTGTFSVWFWVRPACENARFATVSLYELSILLFVPPAAMRCGEALGVSVQWLPELHEMIPRAQGSYALPQVRVLQCTFIYFAGLEGVNELLISAESTVVVAGHICLDITPAFDAWAGGSLSRLLTPGKLVHVGAADVHTGGCVANTGLALQRLGVPARLVARVGCDAFGGLVRDLVQTEGADCRLISDTESSTSYSVVLAPPGIDRVFLHNSGANERFSETDVTDDLLAGARLFHFGYPPLMLRLCRDNGRELLTLFKRVRALGLATSMDMAAMDPGSEAARVDWPSLFPLLMPLTDFFLPSAEELCFMLDRARHTEWLARADGGDVTDVLDIGQDVAPLAASLLAMGCKVVVIKCGARGMYYRTAGAEAFKSCGLPLDPDAWADREGFQPGFVPGQVISATGAGDTSIAAFLASVLEGCTPERCVQRAAATGACCVEAYDALSGLKSLPELDRRIAAGWAIHS